MNGPPRPGRARLAVLVLAVLCVLAGWQAGRLTGASSAPAPSYLEQLTQALDLRPDQVAALEAVLADEDRELDALLTRGLDGIRAEVAQRRSRTEQELVALLDASQRARYESLLVAEAAR